MPAQRTSRTKQRTEPVARQPRIGKPTALGCFMKSISDALGNTPSTSAVLDVQSLLTQGRECARKNKHALPKSFESSSRSLIHDLDDAGLIEAVASTTEGSVSELPSSTGIESFTVTSQFIEEHKNALQCISAYDVRAKSSTPTLPYNVTCDAMRRTFNPFRSPNRQAQLNRAHERKRELREQIAQKDQELKQKDQRIAELEELRLAAPQPSGSSAVPIPATPKPRSRPLVGDGSTTLATPESSPRPRHRERPKHDANPRAPPTPYTPGTGASQDPDSFMGDTDVDSDDEDDTRGDMGGAIRFAIPSAPVSGPSRIPSGLSRAFLTPADAYATPETSWFEDTPNNDDDDDMEVTGQLLLPQTTSCARCSRRDDEIAELERRNAQLQQQLEIESIASNQLRAQLQNRYDELAASHNVLQQDYNGLLHSHNQLQSDFPLLDAQNTLLRQQRGNLQNENEQLRRQRDELQQGYDRLQDDQGQLQQRAAQLQHDLNGLREDHGQLQQEHRQLQQQHGALMLQYGQLQQERDRLQGERDRLQHELDVLRLAHAGLQQQHAQLEIDHERLQAQNLEQRREQQELQERYFSLHQAYDNSSRELEELQGRYNALNQVNSQLRDDYARLGRDYAQLQAANARLQAERDEIRRERDELQGNYAQLQQNHTRLQQDHAQLTQDKATLQANYTRSTEENEQRISDVEYIVNQLGSTLHVPAARRILHHIASLRDRYPLTHPTFASIPALLREWFTSMERQEGGMRQHYLSPPSSGDSDVDPRPGSSTG